MNRRTFLSKSLSATAALWFSGIAGTAFAVSVDDAVNHLLWEISNAEEDYNIPKGLLLAVSLAESGRTGQGGYWIPWPWTLNIDGNGQYFRTYDNALEALDKALNRTKMVAVGAMQISYRWHGPKFTQPNEMLDIRTNVRYGAGLLIYERRRQGSWTSAIGSYHASYSQVDARRQYICRVAGIWNHIKTKNGLKVRAGRFCTEGM